MIDYSIKNPLVVNLFLFLVIIVGILSWQSMPEEMFPVVEKDSIKIITQYDGASPEEVEKQVTIPIEDTLDNLQDIDFYYSKSSEGVSAITLRLKPQADVDELLRTVRDLADAIDGFPEEAEEPEISRVKTRFPVISVSVYGETRQSLLFNNAKNIKQKIMQLDGVAGVGIAGNRDDEIWVIIDPSVISAKNISTKEIVYALKNNTIVGPFNMATQKKQSQLEVIREIKKYIFKYAIVFPIPLFMMKIILGGRSQVIKGGLHLKTDKLINSGYKYKYPTISSILKK